MQVVAIDNTFTRYTSLPITCQEIVFVKVMVKCLQT